MLSIKDKASADAEACAVGGGASLDRLRSEASACPTKRPYGAKLSRAPLFFLFLLLLSASPPEPHSQGEVAAASVRLIFTEGDITAAHYLPTTLALKRASDFNLLGGSCMSLECFLRKSFGEGTSTFAGPMVFIPVLSFFMSSFIVALNSDEYLKLNI